MSGVSFRITAPTASGFASGSYASGSASKSNGRSRRYSSESGSSDDEDGLEHRSRRSRDQSITAIDDRGIRYAWPVNFSTTHSDSSSRSTSAPKKAAPLVIHSAPNTDFRRAAIELRAKKQGKTHFLPNQVGQLTGEDGKKRRELTESEKAFLESNSNVQRIGDKVVQGGIRVKERKEEDMRIDDRADTPVGKQDPTKSYTNGHSAPPQLDEDALALQELLGDKGESTDGPKVHIIPQAEDHVTEDDAYAIDVATRPDVPSLDDYARVPIDDFGAALLRGMGGGNTAQKRKREKVEAYVPKARTALLGIGAKSREDAFGKDYVKEADKGMNKRETMRFVPLQKVERPSASPAPLPSTSSDRRMLEDGKSGSRSRHRQDEDDYNRKSSKRDVDDSRRKSRRGDYSDDSEEERERRRRRKERERARDDESRRDRDRGRDSEKDKDRHKSDKYRERSRSADRDRRDRRDRASDRDDRDRRR